MFAPGIVLHPTDLSELSKGACRTAQDIATQYKAPLLLLHVVETLGPENITFGEAASALEPEGYRKRLLKELQAWAHLMGLPTATRLLIAEGEPAASVEQVARAEKADLIVIGTHGRTGVKRLFMGSIAERIVRLAPCSVLTVKGAP
ncbi:MAG: universal stress protein [Gemmataceae bacterium]